MEACSSNNMADISHHMIICSRSNERTSEERVGHGYGEPTMVCVSHAMSNATRLTITSNGVDATTGTKRRDYHRHDIVLSSVVHKGFSLGNTA